MSAQGLGGTPRLEARQDAQRLVAMVTATFPSGARLGAGIVVGTDERSAYVVTANHLVRRPDDVGGFEIAQIDAGLYGVTALRAELLPVYSAERDVAVIRIFLTVADIGEVRKWRMDMLSSDVPDVLQDDDPVYMLGNPQGRHWRMNGTPERLKLFSSVGVEPLFEFESALLDAGHSGGALLNGELLLTGMIRSETAPYGYAIPILIYGQPMIREPREPPFDPTKSSIARLMTHWNIPFQLRPVHRQIMLSADALCWFDGVGSFLICDGSARWLSVGSFNSSARPFEGERIRGASMGAGHLCAVTITSETFCVGSAGAGQLGVPANGRIYRVPVEVEGARAFAKISAGGDHSCALTPDGGAYCWGANGHGQLGDGSLIASHIPLRVAGTYRFHAISVGFDHSCGISDSEELVCWGNRDVIGTRRAFVEEADSTLPMRMQLTSQPQQTKWGPGELIGDPPAPTIDLVASVAAGAGYTCAISHNGQLFCWGRDGSGRLGTGTTSDTLTPLPVGGSLRFKSVAVGDSKHSCGLTLEGTAYCWGSNQHGELGNGTNVSSSVPQKVSSDEVFDELWVGGSATCGAPVHGPFLCWGKVPTDPAQRADRLLPSPLGSSIR